MATFADLGTRIGQDMKDKAPAVHQHAQADITGLVTKLATKRDVEAPELGQTQDLDDVKVPGDWSQAFSAYATLALHYPVTQAGRLLVLANATRSQVTQLYIPYPTTSPGIWIRSYYQSWGSWTLISGAPNVQDTGWRNVTSLWTDATAGSILIRRIGNVVFARFLSVKYGVSAVNYASRTTLAGFLASADGDLGIVSSLVDTPVPRRLTQNTSGVAVVRPDVSPVYNGHLSWPTDQSWPATLPGTAA